MLKKMETCQPQLELYLAVFDLSQATDFKRMKELSNAYMQWIMTLSDRFFSSLSEHFHLKIWQKIVCRKFACIV